MKTNEQNFGQNQKLVRLQVHNQVLYRVLYRALDRVLLWGCYVIPQWHLSKFRVAYWNKFSRPKILPRYALGFNTWWVDAAKNARLVNNKKKLKQK